MPRHVMPLVDAKVKNAKPGVKDYKLTDGGGMYLLVEPGGGKYWRLKYRFGGKEKLQSIGVYPEISLAGARNRRDAARKLLAYDVDPGETKKAQKTARIAETENGFEAIAREWYAAHSPTWASSHADTTRRRLEGDVYPVLGARPIGDIKAPEVLAMLRRIESRGALEVAHRIRAICGQVFRTDPKEVAPLLMAIDGYAGSFVVKCALQLAPLLFVRPGELRQAEWSEVDFESAEWTIPAEKMKMRQPHLVPLSIQAIAILKELHALTGRGKFLFPSHRSSARPMSNNAVNAALRRMGYEKETMTGHGFRAMARTILDEVLAQRPDIVEHQLAHAVKDPLGRAYNRTSHLPERRRMMQLWADYLDGLKQGAKVIPIRRDVG